MRSLISYGRRTLAIALAVVISGSMLASVALADPLAVGDSDVQLTGVTNVCYNLSTMSVNPVTLNWDTVNLTWPTTSGTYLPDPHDIVVGNLHVEIHATGDPGNRNCGFTTNNTDFTHGPNTLLSKYALQATGDGDIWLGSNAALSGGTQVALGNPGAGINDPTNIYTYDTDVSVDLETIDVDAPAGTYTSTVSVTVSAVGP